MRAEVGDRCVRGLRRVAASRALHPDAVLALVVVRPPTVGVPVADHRRQADRRRPPDHAKVRDGSRRQSGGLVRRRQQESDHGCDHGHEGGKPHRHPGDRLRTLHAVALRERHGEGQLAVAEPTDGDGEREAERVHLVEDGNRDAEHRDRPETTEHGEGAERADLHGILQGYKPAVVLYGP